jgi:FtsP/CotA-like multicopper oxidase with cupredoxin domain
VTKEFVVNARRGGSYGIEWTFNDQAFAGHEHHGPPMLTMERGAWVRLRFVNASFRLHPIHLHGIFFRLLARNGTPGRRALLPRHGADALQGDDRHRPGPARRGAAG